MGGKLGGKLGENLGGNVSGFGETKEIAEIAGNCWNYFFWKNTDTKPARVLLITKFKLNKINASKRQCKDNIKSKWPQYKSLAFNKTQIEMLLNTRGLPLSDTGCML